MVVVKQLDPKYPRMGYEVQKGLFVDMPLGDGHATITEAEDGTLTLSERDGKYSVTLKNVQLSEFVNSQVRINLSGGPDANYLVLEDLKIESPNVTVSSFYGDNRIADTHFRGANHITMTGQMIDDAYIDDSVISGSSNQLPPTEVGGLFLSSVVKRLKADSLPKDSVLRPYTFYTVT